MRNARGERVLFLDTEGLAATDNDERYDAHIFSLGLLLSSLFVFNTMGVIDEGAIDRLYLVSELTKHVCVSTADTLSDKRHHDRQEPTRNQRLSPPPSTTCDNDSDNDTDDPALPPPTDALAEARELAPHFPPFVWLLRDFVLDMRQNGDALTPNEYLERSLEPRDDTGSSRRHDERNRIRASLRVLFARRECLTLVRPVTDERTLRSAAELPETALRPEFVAQMAQIRTHVLATVAAKQLFGKVMDGAKLANLARCYTTTMNSGAVPDIRAAWTYVADATCASATAMATQAYDARLAATNASDDTTTTTILSQSEFEQIHKDAQDEALTIFKLQSVESAARTACFQQLKQHIQKEKAAQIAALQRRSSAFCEQILADLRHRHFQQPIDSGVWTSRVVASEPPLFASTLDALEAAYEQQARGPSKKLAFHHFLRRDAVALVETFLQQLATAHATARATWERQLSAANDAFETRERAWKHELQAKDAELRALLEANARAHETQRTLDARLVDLQQLCEQHALDLAARDDSLVQLRVDRDALSSQHAQLEKVLEKVQLALEYKEAARQHESDHAREAQQTLRDDLERVRSSHQIETESWIRKLADQSAATSGLQKQLKHREHALQQTQLDLELALKEITQLHADAERYNDTSTERTHELHELRAQHAELETHAASAERETTRLHARLERLHAQLGCRERDQQVAAVLTACVAEVARLADSDHMRRLEEEKALLQTQLGQLFLKISTLPDFYQREIFCSPDPTPDFFDALTS